MNSMEDLKTPTITPASDRAIMIRFSTDISEYVHEQVSYFYKILSKKCLTDKAVKSISNLFLNLSVTKELK